MVKRVMTIFAAVIMCFSLAVPAFAVSVVATPVPTIEPTSAPSLVYSEDLEGADGAITDAQTMLESVYDNLPQLNGGVLGFMGAAMQLLPSWFVSAICLSLILSIFVIFLRFLWQ